MFNGTNRWRFILLSVIVLVIMYLIGRYLMEPEVRLFALNAETGSVQWSVSLGNHRTSNPVVANGRVFVDVGSYDDKPDKFWELNAFDAAQGTHLWTFQGSPEDPIIARSKPAAAGDIVVDDLDYDTLGVFDAATGTLLQTIDDIFTGYAGRDLAVALSGGDLIALQQKKEDSVWVNNVLAFRVIDGSQLWKTECSDHCEGRQMVNKETDQPVVVMDNQLVFVTVPERIDVYELDSGMYQFSLSGDCNHVELAGSILYCQEGLSLKAIDVVTRDVRWVFTTPDADLPFLMGLRADDQTVYVRGVRDSDPSSMVLFALDPADGRVRWEKQLWDETGDSRYLWVLSPSAGSKSIFEISILDDRAALVALSATDGSLQWRFPLWGGSYSPVHANGCVFMLDRAPRLHNWLAHLNPAWHGGTADGL